MTESEKYFEVTLSGDAWSEYGDVNEEFYLRKVGELQARYTELLLRNTVGTLEAYYKAFIWEDAERCFKTQIYDILMEEGFLLWNEFANGKLEHWCRYMNESLINIIFLSSNVYFKTLKEYNDSSSLEIRDNVFIREANAERNREWLSDFLTFVVFTFFGSHENERLRPNKTLMKVLGLARFYRMIMLKSGSKATMKVPFPVYFDCPGEFSMCMTKLTSSFTDTLQRQFGSYYRPITIAYDRVRNQTTGESIQWITKENDYQWILDFEAKHADSMKNMVKIRGPDQPIDDCSDWCRSMTSELIDQVYATLNAVNYVHVMYKHILEEHEFNAGRAALRYLMPIEDTCSNFFQIDCIKGLQLTRPGLVGDRYSGLRNKNQWSGRWGIKMFYEMNFFRADEELHNDLYTDDVPFSVRYLYYRHPYPCITLRDHQERALPFAMMGHRDLIADNSRSQPFQSFVGSSPDLMKMIYQYTDRPKSPRARHTPDYNSRDMSPPPYDGFLLTSP